LSQGICLETAAAQGLFALMSLLKAPKSQNSLLISLLAGNCRAETGSYLTAHTTIQSYETANPGADAPFLWGFSPVSFDR
jgi:hypothetical protein